MNTETHNTTIPANRLAAMRALAVVGFVALIFIGMTLAVYTARFVPAAVSSIGQAAVSLSSVFVPAKPVLEVVNTGTQIPFGGPVATTATTTVAATTTTTTTTVTHPATPTAGTQTTNAYPIGTTAGTAGSNTNPATFYGLPDLTVTSISVGYLPASWSSMNDFIPSSSVPSGAIFAVKFTVSNTGTNASGRWDFKAKLPTKQSYTFSSPSQNSMNPGDRTDFMLHLDAGEARTGVDQTVTVTLDTTKDVAESNESNNSTDATVTIR